MTYETQIFLDKCPNGWGYVDLLWMIIFSFIVGTIVVSALLILMNNSIRNFVQDDTIDLPIITIDDGKGKNTNNIIDEKKDIVNKK